MQQSPTARKPDKDALYKVAYEEAVRALSEQQTAIDGVRARAGFLLSAAAITTSFLGARALDGAGLGIAAWMALASFVAVAIVSLAILWPRHWESTASPKELVEDCIDADGSLSSGELHRTLAVDMQGSVSRTGWGLPSSPPYFR